MKAAILAVTLALSGCATYSDTLHNEGGQTYTCVHHGTGIVLLLMAKEEHADCVRDAEAKGFVRAEVK